MFKYLVLALVAIFAGLGGIYFFAGIPRIEKTEFPPASSVYLFKNQDIPLNDIEIYAFYFVPTNEQEIIANSWSDTLEEALLDLKNFHDLQFRKLSEISYKIFPKPILGLNDNAFYDTARTDRGNPFALINISEELQDRVFNESGDLYIKEFAAKSKDVYPVILIMYEGVGAAGGIINESKNESAEEIASELSLPESVIFIVNISFADGFLLVNREIIDGRHGINGSSIMAHEFYHTLGLEDLYSSETGAAQSPDLMGLGRLQPLRRTYLSKEILSNMGL